ncbi:flagellar biosynthetic protein FliR [Mariprofundus micogutta]|uniref:Flagellar biosynthetic protein FliR n=1 Tax=Mariprofundus micogutta TaxID=1921010 RepID=A0A1L8CKG6_9PROT|nr:flagellar biosynthetic protein FliR [Mariprofundus micogutta]GAV19418.1 flagellar biosynthetic protein FliR [Mariprofundus micogutta]
MEFPWPDIQQITVALLVFLRISAMLFLLPVLGHQLVPAQVKVGLIVLLTLLIYPLVQDKVTLIPLEPIAFAAIALQEILIAGALAMFAQLTFTAAQFAGQIMSFQMGMTVANVFDPVTRSQQSVISQLSITLAMLLWVSAGAHHIFLYAMIDSFTLFPIDQPWHFPGLMALTDAAANMFVLSLKIAAPIMLLLFFVYIALGLVSRAVPQIQVFFVSFPLTVGLGLLTFGLGMPAFIYLMSDAFTALSGQVPLFLRHLSGV